MYFKVRDMALIVCVIEPSEVDLNCKMDCIDG